MYSNFSNWSTIHFHFFFPVQSQHLKMTSVFSLLSDKKKRKYIETMKALDVQGTHNISLTLGGNKYLAAFALTTHLRIVTFASTCSKVILTDFIFGNRRIILILFLPLSLS